MRPPRFLTIGFLALLLASCRSPGPKFRFSPLHGTRDESRARPVAPGPPPAPVAPPEADTATYTPAIPRPPDSPGPDRPAFGQQSIAGRPPEQIRPAATPAIVTVNPPARHKRGALPLAAAVVGGAAYAGASLLTWPVLLTTGIIMSALFLVGGAVVLLVRTIGRRFRK